MPLQIDQDRPLTISGSITRDLSKMPQHPLHDSVMKMAERNPALLRLADPVKETIFEVSAKDFLGWVEESGLTEEFLRDLQCMMQTDKGEPLLTSWVAWSRFWTVISGSEGAVCEAIRLQIQGWLGIGLDEVFFDFYAKPAAARTPSH